MLAAERRLCLESSLEVLSLVPSHGALGPTR